MWKLSFAVNAEDEAYLEELLWAVGTTGINSRPMHEKERRLDAFFVELEVGSVMAQLREGLPSVATPTVEEIPDQAWQVSWRENFKPLQVGSFQLVGEWEEMEDGPKIVRIYPGQAFGTGQHETTQLIIEKMESLDFEGKTVLDAGCGNGILAIVAERLGAARVFGFDIDPDCAENMAQHLQMNRTERTELAIGEFGAFKHPTYDRIVANITINVLRILWPDLVGVLAADGVLLNSGILVEQKEEALTHLAANGFEVVEIRQKGEWLMVEARKR